MVSAYPRQLFVLLAVLTSFASAWASEGRPKEDPYLWLEEVEGNSATAWVQGQNTRTTSELETAPIFKQLHSEIREILFAKDRVHFASPKEGFFWNFLEDAEHKHGLLRRTTLEEYRKKDSAWETILDIDALAKAEGENWVYKGSVRLDRSSRYLINLSRGGKDASVLREFDYDTREFVKDGFVIPEGKTRVTPLSRDLLLVGLDSGDGAQTTSGYPRTLKLWARGQKLEDAKLVFEVKETDVSAEAFVVRDGKVKHVFFLRAIDFFNSETFLSKEDGTLQKLPVPTTSALLDVKQGQVYVQLKEGVKLGARTLPSNSLIRFPLEAANLENAQVLFAANDRQSIEDVQVRSDRVYVTLLDNVRSKVLELKQGASGSWDSRELPLPTKGIVHLSVRSEEDPKGLTVMQYTDHLTPASQYLVHDEDGSFRLELLKSSPDRFDASAFEVVQHHATSRDGTQIPYFLIKPKNMAADGSHPTVLYGYGGFEVSLTPSYSGGIGKLWLEKGGVYAIANIRGGGEFGPAWHQAALKENRQRAYDDFIAVAQDLIARKVTSPAHLGIQGGSNGGLLVGAVMVQRPDLFNATLCQVPLLDMLRFSKLLAGASWIGEYGDPDQPKDCEYLLKYSPYHNVTSGQRYPTPFFTTSTKDDRVHPGHARKMAARMLEQGHPLYYFENVNGGHAGSANLEESAYMTALQYTYLWKRLR